MKNFDIEEKIKKEILNEKIVAIQTETVYGFFSRISINNKKNINNLKKRDKNQSIQVSFGSFEQIFNWVDISEKQKQIILKNLPGENSYLLKLKKQKQKILNEKNVLVRFPNLSNDSFLIKLLIDVGPLFSTSVNIHGENELNSCLEIKDKFNVVCYENKNIKTKNKSSKIISLLNDKILILRN